MALVEAGTQNPPKRPKYAKSERKVFDIVKRFDEEIQDESFIMYLKAIAHSISF